MKRLLVVSWAMARASHPLPALAVTAIAAGLLVSTDRPVLAVVMATAAVLAGQLSVGWLNDLVDAPRDARVGRPGKPVATGEVAPALVRGGVAIAVVFAVVLSLFSGLAAAGAHLVAIASAWAYDLGVKATAFSIAPYAVSFGLLPAFVGLGIPGAGLPPVWMMAAAASLGCAAHFANVLPDFDDDAATGVHGLPHRLGPFASKALAAALVLTTSGLLVFGPPGAPSALALAAVPVSVAVLATGFALDRRPGSRTAFHSVMLVALIDVAILLQTGVSAT